MAHFYGEVTGGRGTASRTGTKSSGITAHVRGWDVGVKSEVYHDFAFNEDKIRIGITGGSNNSKGRSYFLWINAGELQDILDGRARLAVVRTIPRKVPNAP